MNKKVYLAGGTMYVWLIVVQPSAIWLPNSKESEKLEVLLQEITTFIDESNLGESS